MDAAVPPPGSEQDIRWDAHAQLHELLAGAIEKTEASQQAALRAALNDHHREHEVHAAAHEQEHRAHGREHGLADLAITKASDAAGAALKAALEDHHREHTVHEAAHAREHEMNAEAVRIAGTSLDKRLQNLNEFREQLRDQARTFASTERVEGLIKEIDRRFGEISRNHMLDHEANRARIEAIEKGDVQQSGKGAGQAATLAAIVATISVVGAILAIVVVVANFAGGA